MKIRELIIDSTKKVLESAQFVKINDSEINKFSRTISYRLLNSSNIESSNIWSYSEIAPMLQRSFVIGALNFSFWPDGKNLKWGIHWDGINISGARALVGSIDRAINMGIPILEVPFLKSLDEKKFFRIFEGTNNSKIPMAKERIYILNEIGFILSEKYDNQFINVVEESNYDAEKLVRLIVTNFPSFDDVTSLNKKLVYFFKRAQLLVWDAFFYSNNNKLGKIKNVDSLTAFADYKLPQILRNLQMIEYEKSLSKRITNLERLSLGSREEVEIRASTVQSVEKICDNLKLLNKKVCPASIDLYLWELSHSPEYQKFPHHRTRTIFY
jgi:hypothetical protein